MVCKVTATRNSPPPCPLLPLPLPLRCQKGQAVRRVAHTFVTYTPRVCSPVCVWRKQKQKSYRLVEAESESGRQAGRSKKYANVNYFVRNLLSCFERTSPLAASRFLSPSPSAPALTLHGVISMNIHIHIRIMFALIISWATSIDKETTRRLI